jgi:glucose/arabinose dehydrogenase
MHRAYRTNSASFMVVLIASNALVVVTSVILSPFIIVQYAAAQPSIIKDPNLKVESLVSGLSSPTNMAFVDNNHILVLEKGGNVRLVSNGQLQSQPVLHVSVDVTSERGLLGIAVMNSSSSSTNNNKVVFLY